MINWIMKVAPIGAFGAMAFTIGKYGIHSLLPLGETNAGFYATCLFLFWASLGAICRFNGFQFFAIWPILKRNFSSFSEPRLPKLSFLK